MLDILGWLLAGALVCAIGLFVLAVIIAVVKAIRKPKNERTTQTISSATGIEG